MRTELVFLRFPCEHPPAKLWLHFFYGHCDFDLTSHSALHHFHLVNLGDEPLFKEDEEVL